VWAMATTNPDLKVKLLARAQEFLPLVDCVDDEMLRVFRNCSPSSARSYCTNRRIATVLVTNPRHGSPACGSGGTSAPKPNQHCGHAEHPCSRRQQGSHGVLSLATSDIGERCEAEGI
jgi:hypothetical protein